MIIDITGIELTPGNNGADCLGNGEHYYPDGTVYECCCDECNYLMCCLETHDHTQCKTCDDKRCPRSPNCSK